MSISTQITVVATAEAIVITAPGALRGPPGPAGPEGDVTPEVTQLVAEAEAAAEAAEASKDSAGQSAVLSSGFKDEAEAAAQAAAEQLEPVTEQAAIASEAASRADLSAQMATGFSNPFVSIADGLANTSGSGATNRFFSVPGAGSSLAIAYRNDSGVAVNIGSSPSSENVDQALEEVLVVSERVDAIEPGASRIIVDPSTGDMLLFLDGSPDMIVLARFDVNGFWIPSKHDPKVQAVIDAILPYSLTDDLIVETDSTEDKLILRRVDKNGVNWGKWDGVFPDRLENAGSLAAESFAVATEASETASRALAAISGGPWGKLKQLMQTSFVHGLNPVQRPTLGLTALVTSTLPAGLTKAIDIGRTPEAFSYIGGIPIRSGANYGFKAVSRVNGTGNLGGNNSSLQWSVEVMVDAKSPAFRVPGNNDEFRFIVDGQYYSNEVITALGGGFNCWIQLQFETRAVRHIRICGVGRFGGVAVGPTENAWHPGDAGRLRVSFIGDSFTDGAQSSGPDRSWTTQLAYLCGISNPWAVAVGGTGYVSVGANLGNFGSDIRISDTVASNPEMIFFFGSVNDRQNTVAEIQAAALSAWRAYRLTFPDIPFVIIGCATPATGIPADAVKVDNALADAFAEWGDNNADFIRVTTDPQGPWLYGTGYISSNPATSNGSGNNDVYMGRAEVNDGTHPNNAGHHYIARRVAQPLYQIALSK